MREVIYENRDATVWCVTGEDGAQHWETKVGIQRVLPFETEEKALAHVRLWEGEARHDRLHRP
ncbi:hypothetical protein [Brevundimonas vesicularis]|uniref:hypothetical protein n=1 Tax=Brevundimonas vesicularis TaxID=41276 RepID=UPI00384A49D2